jgi:hypothetical protein
MALFSLWVLYILVVMLCIYHGSRVDWVLTRVGVIRLCLPALLFLQCRMPMQRLLIQSI